MQWPASLHQPGKSCVHAQVRRTLRVTAAFLAVVAFCLTAQVVDAQSQHAPQSQGVAPAAGGLIINLLQIDRVAPPTFPQGQPSGVECMRARSRARNYGRWSWLAAAALALLIYTAWLFLAPRFLPSGGKWLISPILASLLVAVSVAVLENSLLTEGCGEPSGWRFDTMSTTFLMNWLFFVLLIFIALAGLRYFLLRRRMNALRAN